MTGISPVRRTRILDALRRGTVPPEGLDQLAVGLDHLSPVLEEELDKVADGSANFKAFRGEYGSGKTFASRWTEQLALRRGFAVSEVQISELETPLHKLETVYRRTTEELRTDAFPGRAFRSVLDAWLFQVDADAAASGRDRDELISRRLTTVAQVAPVFPLALRGYLRAVEEGKDDIADGLAAWLGGQRNVAASVKRYAGVKSELDHFTAMGFLRGLLEVLRGSGHTGLLLVLDEVETLQRMRTDSREKALNALRQWIDEIDKGNYPGLYLLITGTTAFFEGPQGVKRLQPLDERLRVDFSGDPRWDNPRLPQVRLHGFTRDKLIQVGLRVRDLYASGLPDGDAARLRSVVSDDFTADLADAVAGQLGGRFGVAPRQFLRITVDVLDRVDMYPGFDPRTDYVVAVPTSGLTEVERAASAASGGNGSITDPDDIVF